MLSRRTKCLVCCCSLVCTFPQSQKYTFKSRINIFCVEEHWRYPRWTPVAPYGLTDLRLCLFSDVTDGIGTSGGLRLYQEVELP